MLARSLCGLMAKMHPSGTSGIIDLILTQEEMWVQFPPRVLLAGTLRLGEHHAARRAEHQTFRQQRQITILNTLASLNNAAIAQLGERQTEDLKVPGSIPGLGTSVIARNSC